MNARDLLKESIETNRDIQRILLPMTLRIGIGTASQEPTIKNENELREILSKLADILEQGIFSIVSNCHKMTNANNANDADELKDMLLDDCRILSDLDAVICEKLGFSSTSFGFLRGDEKCRLWACNTPWYEELLRNLPSWLDDIARHAMALDEELRGECVKVDYTGYVTNFDILGFECVPADLDGRTGMLGEYSKAGIPPFIMRYCDYKEFVRRVFVDRFGGYDASNTTHVLLRRKLLAAVVSFECEVGDGVETCIILPYCSGKGWRRPYSSLEKRWIVDLPRLKNTDVMRLIEIAKHNQWEKPSFPEIV